jgi:transcriptional regulator with XRE-family HTH domain
MGERNLMRERQLDPGASPAAFFGNEVREARTGAKMSQAALGAAVVRDDTYVSKVETGAIVPDDEFVNALDSVFPNMNGWFARFWSNSRKWEGQYPAWFKDWVEAELHARMIRWWEPLLIPGLLQTADYARELFRAWQTIEDPDMVERNVSLRMDRQQIFDRPNPLTLLAVIDETVLWRCIGNSEIMRTQLEYLIDMSTRPNISIHIVPASVGAHAGLLGAFILADFEGESGKVVYLETPDQGFISDAATLAAKILGSFERVRSEALPKGASRELIRRVVSERWTP